MFRSWPPSLLPRDDGHSLGEKKRDERMPEVVWPHGLQARGLGCATETALRRPGRGSYARMAQRVTAPRRSQLSTVITRFQPVSNFNDISRLMRAWIRPPATKVAGGVGHGPARRPAADTERAEDDAVLAISHPGSCPTAPECEPLSGVPPWAKRTEQVDVEPENVKRLRGRAPHAPPPRRSAVTNVLRRRVRYPPVRERSGN